MSEKLNQLQARLRDVHNLEMAGAVLHWDQETYMPPGGIEARTEQRATISKIAHQIFTDEQTGNLLEASERENAGDENTQAFLRVARRDFDRATKLSTDLVEERTRVTSQAQDEWAKARAQSEYSHFAPWLDRVLDISRQTAQAYGYKNCAYDALLDEYEEGMTRAQLDPIFEQLKNAVVPLLKNIAQNSDRVSDQILRREYSTEKQKEFAERVLADCGFDFSRGRQDVSVHPFCTNFGRDDVRLTTRYASNDLQSALFGSLHEMGHGLYEQNIAQEFDGTPLGGGASLGVHESQSRLWENLVGRSREFWNRYFEPLKAVFPEQLNSVLPDEFYRAMNKVEPSFIRVEADEATYNLHIIVRYEIENELLEGKLSTEDAPQAWNAKMQDYFGITPPDDAHGILQDVHWSLGAIGYFPTYSLGNVLSVQLWETALQTHPQIPDEISRGEFPTLLNWLRENVHQHGRKFPPQELIQRATGRPLDVAPYAQYLSRKFGEVYGL